MPVSIFHLIDLDPAAVLVPVAFFFDTFIFSLLCIGIRLEQAKRFNDPNDEHKVLVASDAIGMGINLYVTISLWPICHIANTLACL